MNLSSPFSTSQEMGYIFLSESQIDDELTCLYICHLPLTDPVSHEGFCDHSFCKNCIRLCGYICPLCGTGNESEFRPVKTRLVLNQLSKIEVECLSCHQRMLRSEFQDHKKRLIKSSERDSSTKEISACVFVCPLECGQKIVVDQLDYHMQIECDNYTIECVEKEIGCRFKGKRKEMELHLNECFIHKNRELVIFFEEKLTRVEKIYNQELHSLSHKLTQSEQRYQTLQEQFNNLTSQFITLQQSLSRSNHPSINKKSSEENHTSSSSLPLSLSQPLISPTPLSLSNEPLHPKTMDSFKSSKTSHYSLEKDSLVKSLELNPQNRTSQSYQKSSSTAQPLSNFFNSTNQNLSVQKPKESASSSQSILSDLFPFLSYSQENEPPPKEVTLDHHPPQKAKEGGFNVFNNNLHYHARVSTKNMKYSVFCFAGLSSGTKELLTTSKSDDFIRIDFGKEILLKSFIVKPPTTQGMDAKRINGALFEVFNSSVEHLLGPNVEEPAEKGVEWETVLMIKNVKNGDACEITLPEMRQVRWCQIRHGDAITSQFCLGLGMLRFIGYENLPYR